MSKHYIQLARLFHTPTRVIIFKHLLPQVIQSLIVLMIVDVGKIISEHNRVLCKEISAC